MVLHSSQNPGIKDTTIELLEDGKEKKLKCKTNSERLQAKVNLLNYDQNMFFLSAKHLKMFAFASMAKNYNDIPSYYKRFLTKNALCEAPTTSCWYDKCTKCKTMMQSELEEATCFMKGR